MLSEKSGAIENVKNAGDANPTVKMDLKNDAGLSNECNRL